MIPTFPLSPRQEEIYHLMLDGLSSKEIGRRLFISADTVRTHKRALYKRLGGVNATILRTLAVARDPIRYDIYSLYKGGLTYREIAERLHISRGTVAGHLARIRERQTLEREI